MLQIPVSGAVVQIDLDNPSVGMGQGAIEMQSGMTKVPFPFQVVAETDVTINADELIAATKEELKRQNIALSPVRVLGAN